MSISAWKAGRGKLGPLAPLLGAWEAQAESPMGPIRCERAFAPYGDAWVRLDVAWVFGPGAKAGPPYRETAFIGPDSAHGLVLWSFTSDGKRSEGRRVDAPDIHPKALAFESDMPAGLARQIYWPGNEEALRWAVEARNKTGWKRFTDHVYRRIN